MNTVKSLVIINGTSWYHACSCPNLLIDEYNIDRFKELNNKMYVHGTSKDRYEFRKQTFELINKRVSESAYRKLSECGCADEILIGQNVNEVFFEAVGIYTYKKLMKSDEDCKKIVDFIYKYYFGDIEFIFLTSGYEPFMKGLVKEYMKSFHKNCTWRTIGSTIKFSNGCIYLKEVMTQEKKFQFVKKIIDYGNRVVFLADDSVEEKELFSVVFRNGGYAFNVRYDEKLHESNWHELINDIEDENVFLSYLMKNSEVALSDCKKVQNNFFRLHMNEIGVICLNDIEYQIFLGSFNRDKKIVEYIKKVSHKKEEKYYLRGRYYYYWLPSYITGSLESKYAGWKKIVIDGIDIIEHIARYNIKENKYACILSYVICDHLLSVLYLAMYCAEEDVLDRERNVISSYRHIENSVCILNKILFSVFDNKIEYSNLDSLVKELKSISFEDMDIIRENEKFLLELDNYNTIYEAVYNIIDNLKVKAQKIDKVIYFAYGGISLGYAFKTIMKELFDKNVELLPSHYSSKRNNTESGIIDRIPRFKCGENGWMDESTVLLLDNNVTTFKTLSTSKSYLQKRGNKVYCAVAEVDYKNIYKWLLGKGEYEEMCHNWFDVIDAKPIMNYFSAYNTWGTSETSALLEQLYSQDFIFQNTDNLIPRKIHSEHRKICRIHNVYDLRLAMEMGATMIGIHAVISCKDKYYKIEDYENKVHSVPDRIVSISQPYIRPIARGKAKAPVEFGAKLDLSIDENGIARLERLSFDAYNESDVFITAVENYKSRTGHYPERVLVDQIYRNRTNRAFCSEHGIRISGPALGRPKKDNKVDKKQEYIDNNDRIEVERAFSLAKRRYGLGLITAKLDTNTKSSIALSIIAMNVNLLTVVSFAQILVSLFSRNKLMHCTVKYMKNKSYKDLAIC